MGDYGNRYRPEQFAEKLFKKILFYARENNRAFKEHICDDYHATLFVSFFVIYGIDLVNYFIVNKYGSFNKEISTKLFWLMTERIYRNFPAEEAKMISDCVSVMEDEVMEALKLPFDEGLKNPFYKLALYIPTIIDIRGEYNRLYANQLLFNCLGETFAGIGKMVNENELASKMDLHF